MDPVTITAGIGAAASALRLGHVWLSARAHSHCVELEIRREQEQRATLVATISSLPPGAEITELLPDGRSVTIKLPPDEAA